METDVGHLHLSFSTLTFPLVENEDEGKCPTSFHPALHKKEKENLSRMNKMKRSETCHGLESFTLFMSFPALGFLFPFLLEPAMDLEVREEVN